MKIEKDAEWLRLEGKVGQLRGSLTEAEMKLENHASAVVAKQLGITLGTTVVEYQGDRYIASRIDDYSPGWIKGRRTCKDGQLSRTERNLYDEWKIVTD